MSGAEPSLLRSFTPRVISPLLDKVALVTGGSRGIGAAIAQRLAADGAAVALTFNSSPEKAEEVVQAIAARGGRALAIRTNAGDMSAAKASVSRTIEAFGRLDILVNNAGIGLVKELTEFSAEDFDLVVNANMKGMFFTTQEALRHLGEGGRIINIGSINSDRVHFVGGSLYAMSKAAVAGFTKALARDVGHLGITVNNVLPGPTETDMNPAVGDFADGAGAGCSTSLCKTGGDRRVCRLSRESGCELCDWRQPRRRWRLFGLASHSWSLTSPERAAGIETTYAEGRSVLYMRARC